jgi:hypothetical protein
VSKLTLRKNKQKHICVSSPGHQSEFSMAIRSRLWAKSFRSSFVKEKDAAYYAIDVTSSASTERPQANSEPLQRFPNTGYVHTEASATNEENVVAHGLRSRTRGHTQATNKSEVVSQGKCGSGGCSNPNISLLLGPEMETSDTRCDKDLQRMQSCTVLFRARLLLRMGSPAERGACQICQGSVSSFALRRWLRCLLVWLASWPPLPCAKGSVRGERSTRKKRLRSLLSKKLLEPRRLK